MRARTRHKLADPRFLLETTTASPILPVSFADKLFRADAAGRIPVQPLFNDADGTSQRESFRRYLTTAFSKLIAGGLPVQDALVTSGLIGATGE